MTNEEQDAIARLELSWLFGSTRHGKVTWEVEYGVGLERVASIIILTRWPIEGREQWKWELQQEGFEGHRDTLKKARDAAVRKLKETHGVPAEAETVIVKEEPAID